MVSMTGSPPDVDGIATDELRRLLIDAFGKVVDLTTENAALREEIARLKGLKGRPSIKPSGMEQASAPKPPAGAGKRRGRGSKQLRRVAIEDRVLPAEAPAGSRFKGYESFLIQDLVLRPVAIRFRRERWVTPDGRTVVAPLPPGSTAISGRSCAASCWLSITRARSPCHGWWHCSRRSVLRFPSGRSCGS